MGNREPSPHPPPDLVPGSIAVRHGRIDFVHPRDAMQLVYDQDFTDDQAYPPYWAELWPSGVELAYAVSEHPLDGLSVLELGCGLGLPSIAAALAGGRVLATDRSADATALASVNAARSGATLETGVYSWTEPGSLIDRGPWSVVLASDVLYNDRNSTELLALLPRLVDSDGVVWISDPGRPATDDFLVAARRDGHDVSTDETRLSTVKIHRLTCR